MVPVVNRVAGVLRCRDLNRGNPTARPARLPTLLAGELVIRDVVSALGGTLGDIGLDETQGPVMGDAGSPGMGDQRALLDRCGVEREAVGAGHGGHAESIAACTALLARFAAPRRP